MMQKKLAGQEPANGNGVTKEGRSTEEIREIIRTIESYLERTRESIEHIEKVIAELREESRTADEKEKARESGPEDKKALEPRHGFPLI